MAFPYADIASIGDVLPVDRFALYFPTIPSGGEGKDLTLRNAGVSLPAADVGQVVVKTFGWSLAFAGRRTMANTFSTTFVETTDAPALHSLYAWQNMCAGFKYGVTSPKSDYAVNAKLVAKDTTGKYAIECKLHNVWPKTITTHEFGETSAGLEIEVEFSIDAVDLLDIKESTSALATLQTDFTTASTGTTTRVGGFSAGPGGISPSFGGGSPSVSIGLSSLSSLSAGSFSGFNIAQNLVSKITGGGFDIATLATTGDLSSLASTFTGVTGVGPSEGLSTFLGNTLGASNNSDGGFGSSIPTSLSQQSGITSILSSFFG